MIVVFPDHTHFLFSYSSILLSKIQQKKGKIGLSVRVVVVVVCVCVWGGGGRGGYHAISRT